jgi:PAS domain-containing protein
LFTPEQELSIGALEQSPLATYINAIKSQKKFYANPVALDAQGKPPEDFLDGNAYDLNDPDELDSRTSRIATGETLRSYEYEAWRWYFDADAERFRLKRMQFTSNFRLLNSFNGVPCWLGQVLEASELSRRQP